MADLDVLMLMGSASDWKHFQGAVDVLRRLGLSAEVIDDEHAAALFDIFRPDRLAVGVGALVGTQGFDLGEVEGCRR